MSRHSSSNQFNKSIIDNRYRYRLWFTSVGFILLLMIGGIKLEDVIKNVEVTTTTTTTTIDLETTQFITEENLINNVTSTTLEFDTNSTTKNESEALESQEKSKLNIEKEEENIEKISRIKKSSNESTSTSSSITDHTGVSNEEEEEDDEEDNETYHSIILRFRKKHYDDKNISYHRATSAPSTNDQDNSYEESETHSEHIAPSVYDNETLNDSGEVKDEYEDEEDSDEDDDNYDNYNPESVCTAEYFLNKIIPEDYPEEISKDVHHINETIERINRMYTFSSKMMENFKPLFRELTLRFSDFIYESKLDPNCMGAMFRVITSIRDRKSWALSFLDSTGSIFTGGFQEGTFVSFGEFDQCLEIRSDDLDGYYRPIRGQYCLLKPMIPVPEDMKIQKGEKFVKSKLKTVDRFLNEEYMETYLELFKFLKKTILRIGICLPDRCDPKGVEDAINQFLVRKTGLSVQVGPNCVIDDTEIVLDNYQIITLFVICFLVILILISTLYELIQRGMRDYAMYEDTRPRLPTARKASAKIRLMATRFSRQMSTSYIEQSIQSQIWTTFSLIRNTRVLFDSNPLLFHKRLLPLDTMRLLLILFFFICNSYYFTLVFAPMLVKRFYALGPLQFFTQKKYLFIRMFYMTDCLVAFSGIGIALAFNARKFNLFRYYVRNYLRYLLPILFSIGLIYIVPLLGNGPLWHLFDDTLSRPCRNNLLPTLLFFNNLNENIEETCNFPTVFVSMIFQLQLAAPVFLFIANRFRPGADLAVLILFTGLFSLFNSVPRLFFDEKIPYEMKEMKSFTEIKHSLMYYMFHPFSHAAQFLFGLSIGTLIKLKHRGHITIKFRHILMSGLGALALWIFQTANMAQISILKFDVPLIQMIPMVSFGYIFSSSFVCWLIVASGNFTIVNRFLSSIAFRPMTQLSYGFFVTSIVVACFRLFSIRQNVILSPQNMFRSIVSDAVVSFLLSYVIHVMIQQPYRNLIKLEWAQLFQSSIDDSSLSTISKSDKNRKHSEMSDTSASEVAAVVSELINFSNLKQAQLDDNLDSIKLNINNNNNNNNNHHHHDDHNDHAYNNNNNNHNHNNSIPYIDQLSQENNGMLPHLLSQTSSIGSSSVSTISIEGTTNGSRKNSTDFNESTSILLNDLNNNNVTSSQDQNLDNNSQQKY